MNLNLESLKEVIVNAQVIDDMGGTFIDLTFANGSRLRIAPENDVVVFWKNGQDDQSAHDMLFCDMGSGHHEPGAPSSALLNHTNG